MEDIPEYDRKEETLATLRAIDGVLQKQLLLIERLTDGNAPNSGKRLNTMYSLLKDLVASGRSVTFLVRNHFISESYIVARAFLERIVNICYLMICNEKDFDDYVDFSKQKVIRSLHTKKEAYEKIKRIVPLPDFSKIHEISEVMNKYTSASGKEITRWTTLKIEKRIHIVAEKVDKFNEPIYLAATGLIYEDASEAIHGTLYGSLFPYGLLYGVDSVQRIGEYVDGSRMLLMLLLSLLIDGLLKVVHAVNANIDDLVQESWRNCTKTKLIFKGDDLEGNHG